jgi:hypothetical protein
MSGLREAGQPLPPPDGPVWTAARDRKGAGGRYHTRADCWAVPEVDRKRRRLWQHAAEAEADRWYLCAFCAPPPECCARGEHLAQALPRLAPAEMPEWEREMLQQEGAIDASEVVEESAPDDFAAWLGED